MKNTPDNFCISRYYKEKHGHSGFFSEKDRMHKMGFTQESLTSTLNLMDSLFKKYDIHNIKAWLSLGTLLCCVRESMLSPWIRNINVSVLVDTSASSRRSRFYTNRSICLEGYEIIEAQDIEDFHNYTFIKILPNMSEGKEVGYGIKGNLAFIVYRSMIKDCPQIFRKFSYQKNHFNPIGYRIDINDMYITDLALYESVKFNPYMNSIGDVCEVFFSRDISNGIVRGNYLPMQHLHIEPLVNGILYDRSFNIPNNSKKILEDFYGKSWFIPQKNVHAKNSVHTTKGAMERWEKIESSLTEE